MTTSTTDMVRYTRPAPATLGFTGLLERVTGLGMGAAGIAMTASVDAIERFVPTEPTATNDERMSGPMGDVVHLVPGALLGVGFAMRRALLATSGAIERNVARAVNTVGRPQIVQAPIGAAERYLDKWNALGTHEQQHNEALVTEFTRRLAPALAEAIVTRLDVAELVEQLPIDAIIDQVDVNALLARVDVTEVIDRVDLNQLIERVDINQVMSRVDLDALLARVDIGPIAQRVLDEIDISAIVRDSTGSVAGDLVDGGRVTAMRLDDFTARITDRILFRRAPRKLVVEEYDIDASEHPAAGTRHD
ncbi:MAG: hypothetical protein ACOYNI_01550 [Acidimicrobiia bacterium]